MKPILALSTCWCSPRHQDGYAMLREMSDLGFEYVEMSHGIRITLVPGALKAIEEGVIKVASTHNFCPLPTGVQQAAPNLFQPSSTASQERDQWVRYTKRSIDFAAQVGARLMVCHLGSVPFLWANPEHRLERFAEAHPDIAADAPAFAKARAKALKRMRGKMEPYWRHTQDNVLGMLGYAAEHGIKLAFENREGFTELPLDEDYQAFIEGLPADAAAGYWHDTGHARIKERLGLLDHREHLQKMAPRQLGFHLHDVDSTGRDHQAVGSGEIDFEMVSSFWKAEHLLVLELSPRLDPEAVLRSKQRIDTLRQRIQLG